MTKTQILTQQQKELAAENRDTVTQVQEIVRRMDAPIEHLNDVQVYLCNRMTHILNQINMELPEKDVLTYVTQLNTLLEVASVSRVKMLNEWEHVIQAKIAKCNISNINSEDIRSKEVVKKAGNDTDTTYYVTSVSEGFETRLPIVKTSESYSPFFHPFSSEETEEVLGVELPLLGSVYSYSTWKEAIELILEKGMGQLTIVSDYPRVRDKEDLFKELQESFSKPNHPFNEIVSSEFFHDPISGCYFKDLD